MNLLLHQTVTDCESDFVPMSDIFRNQYRNELNARNLVLTFTLLCFLVADLGLIVFMGLCRGCPCVMAHTSHLAPEIRIPHQP